MFNIFNKDVGKTSHWAHYSPLYGYLLLYFLTCFLGCLFYFADWKEFIALFESISGMSSPILNHHQKITNVLLVLVAPMLLAGGYVIGCKRHLRFQDMVRNIETHGADLAAAQIIFYGLVGYVAYRLMRFGIFDQWLTWLNYNDWVKARWLCFSKLNFFDFTLIYTIIPITSILILTLSPSKKIGYQIFRWIPFFIAIFLCLSIFQKKAALIVILMFFFMFNIRAIRVSKSFKKIIRVFLIVIGTLFLIFSTMVYVLSLNFSNAGNQRLQSVEIREQKTGSFLSDVTRHAQAKATIAKTQVKATIAKTILLASMTRTSIPSLYYPVIFPENHGYYGLDLGQDIFGYGKMPDDHLVVWDVLNPEHPGGLVTAPYQFALYSQVGLAGALLLSFVIGYVLGLCWRFFLDYCVGDFVLELLGIILQLFLFYLAMDAGRDSFLSSYGMIWGILYIFFLRLIVKIKDKCLDWVQSGLLES